MYEEKFMHLELYNHTYDFFCEALKIDNPLILDAGCGPGNISRYILEKNPGFRIFGIDIAPKMVALAMKNNPAASFTVMDLRSIDQLEARYDGIICGFGLPYLSETDAQKFIFDCHTLLVDQGLLYLSFVPGDPESSGYKTGTPGDRVYFYFHSEEKLQKQLVKSGFRVMKYYEMDYKRSERETEIHAVLIAKKTQ